MLAAHDQWPARICLAVAERECDQQLQKLRNVLFFWHTFHAKKLIEYPVDINEVALASLTCNFVTLQIIYSVPTKQLIGPKYLSIGEPRRKYAEAMRTAFNINEEIVIRLAVNIGNDHYCQHHQTKCKQKKPRHPAWRKKRTKS